MKTLLLTLSLLFSTVTHADYEFGLALDLNGSRICTMYATDRGYEGDRKQRSLDVCNAAVKALISTGDFNSISAESDPHSHLNRVCGINGQTFKMGDQARNGLFLQMMVSNLSIMGYTIYPNDFDGIKNSFVKGQEPDLFAPSNFSTTSCSTLLYVLFRIENYVRSTES